VTRVVSLRTYPPDPGEVFAPDAFDHLLGVAVPWSVERAGRREVTATATITWVDVSPDGDFAVIFAELDEPLPETIDTRGLT
jgi:hypothetical protein